MKQTHEILRNFLRLLINQAAAPTVKIFTSFNYLGRYSNFSMKNSDDMSEVLKLMTDLINKIDTVTPKTSFFCTIGLLSPNLRISGPLLRLLESCLLERTQYVQLNKSKSKKGLSHMEYPRVPCLVLDFSRSVLITSPVL